MRARCACSTRNLAREARCAPPVDPPGLGAGAPIETLPSFHHGQRHVVGSRLRHLGHSKLRYSCEMPELSHEEIVAAIAKGGVFAISIDTSVFDAKQKTFQNPVLRRLDQFQKRDVRVVITDVVANEMKAHLRDEALETQRTLKKALRKHNTRWQRENADEELDQLLIRADASAFSDDEFNSFLEHINGEVLESSATPNAVRNILTKYFSQHPPFGAADKRKSEFPDAFALLALEALAEQEGRLLLCVAPDKGWVDFAAESEHLICIDKLEEALSLFNAAADLLRVVDAIAQKWHENEAGDFLEAVQSALEYRLEDLDFDIDAYADVEFEADPLSAALQNISNEKISKPTIIAADDETVTFTVRVEALVGFEATFSFSVFDSIDKDYVFLNSHSVYVEKTLPFDLTITADRVFDEGLIFHEVEVSRKHFEVDFGHVEPFPGEDPTHEKY